MKVDRQESGQLVIHSMFRTIQGEGPFAGHNALFIRLTGCNLQCPGCDTEYTSKSNEAAPKQIIETMAMFYEWDNGLVVITGGEPFRQNITPFVKLLLHSGYTVQIESNGVLYPGDLFPWNHPRLTVVVSPKTGKINPNTAVRAHVYKYVLSWDSVAPDGLPETALGHPLGRYSTVARPPVGWDGPIYVNPMDHQDPVENKRSHEAVVRSVMNFDYIMGVQIHKIVGLP